MRGIVDVNRHICYWTCQCAPIPPQLLLGFFIDKLLFLGHRSLIKKITQTAVINIVFQRIFIKLDASYASQHTFSKVAVTIFENYTYIVKIKIMSQT